MEEKVWQEAEKMEQKWIRSILNTKSPTDLFAVTKKILENLIFLIWNRLESNFKRWEFKNEHSSELLCDLEMELVCGIWNHFY